MALVQNRIVVKVGTSSLTNDAGNTNLRAFDQIALVLSDIANLGYEVILVSSGAIAVGSSKMGLKEKPKSMRMKQAAAAVGQCQNMFLYDKFFGEYSHTIAQILLNAEDIEQEEKKEKLTNTFNALLECGIIPIVNENIDGLYEADPRFHPQAKLIRRIDQIDEELYHLAGGAGSRRGTGGMRTKLQAAELATRQGIDVTICNGKRPEALYDIVKGVQAGTLFAGRLNV